MITSFVRNATEILWIAVRPIVAGMGRRFGRILRQVTTVMEGSEKPTVSASVVKRLAEQAGDPDVRKTLRQITAKLEKATSEELRRTLVRAGILDENGELTEKYKQ